MPLTRNMYNIALDLPGEEENLCIDIPTDMGNNVSMWVRMTWAGCVMTLEKHESEEDVWIGNCHRFFLKYVSVTAFGFLLWHVFPQVQRHPGSQGLEPINKWFICYNLSCNREDNIPNLKVNHSFEPNSEFILFSAHPVLGTVMALAAMEDMVAGQELTVNYGYVGTCRQ